MAPARHAATEEAYLCDTYETVAPLLRLLLRGSVHHSSVLLSFTRTPKINGLVDSVGQLLVNKPAAHLGG